MKKTIYCALYLLYALALMCFFPFALLAHYVDGGLDRCKRWLETYHSNL